MTRILWPVGLLCCVAAQKSPLLSGDSLVAYVHYAEALAVYDSLERLGGLSSQDWGRLQFGKAEAYLGLRQATAAQGAARQADSLAALTLDTLLQADAWQTLAIVYALQKDFSTAESLLSQAQRKYESAQALTRRHVPYLRSLRRSAFIAFTQKRYATAETLCVRTIDLLQATALTEHPEYAYALHLRARICRAQLRYTEAELWYLEDKKHKERFFGREHPEYALTLHNLGVLYIEKGQYAEAERLLTEARSVREKVLGAEHLEYINTLNGLAVVYRAQGRYREAESLLQQVQAYRTRRQGKEHPDYLASLNNLAVLYSAQGRYSEAEALYNEMRSLAARLSGIQSTDYALALTNLASNCRKQGRYTEAEHLYLEAKNIRSALLGIDHPLYATTLNNLANIYDEQGRFSEAEQLFTEVARIRLRVFGAEHPEYIHALVNLSNTYWSQKRYSQAEEGYRRALSLYRQIGLEGSPEFMTTATNLAAVCGALGRLAEAESLYIVIALSRKESLGEAHPNYLGTLSDLAGVWARQGRHPEAESLYAQILPAQQRALGPLHPHYLGTLRDFAGLYASQARYEKSDSLWQELVRGIFERLRQELPALPAAHRQKLLENIVEEGLQDFQRYVALRNEANPALLELGYRAARNLKGLILSSVEGMRYLVERQSRQDTTLPLLYARWQEVLEQYAFFTFQGLQREADSLREEASNLERQLIVRLPEIARYFPDLEREALFPPLQRHEALIEVVRLPSTSTDSILYLYYCLLPQKKGHRLHLQVYATHPSWELQALTAYEIASSPAAELSGAAYRLLWAHIDSLLPRNLRTLYFAPDGVYYRINIATLYDTKRKGFLGDKVIIRYIASSRRLLLPSFRVSSSKSAVLGNPDFYGQSVGVPQDAAVRSARFFAGRIPSLPGAEEEAKLIAPLLHTEPVIGEAATESYLKSLRSPYILHIATHGYFIGEERDPMLAGGLLLAQAGVWDSLYAPFGVEDGRLTAQEASTLNLLGTELVVLSACETALGKIKGEELYGLQRGFLEAGARRVMAALWPVDDTATRELMETFYRRWQANPKLTVEEAFTAALRDLRKKYPHPYYWGAFVVMQ